MNTLLYLILGIVHLRWLEQHLGSLEGQLTQLHLGQVWQPDHIAIFAVRDVLDLLIVVLRHIAIFFFRLLDVLQHSHLLCYLSFAFLENFLLEIFSQVIAAQVHLQNRVWQREALVNWNCV